MKNRPAHPQFALRRHGGRLVRYPSLDVATQADFGSPLTAVFVHGYTADAEYMSELMHQFNGSGFASLAFEYPSDRGIHYAARVLMEQLDNYNHNDVLTRDRIVLVCHSMGGLVGRALIGIEGGAKYVRKIITLGTPHDGTLNNSIFVRLMLNWGEYVSGLNPAAFLAGSTSANELIGADPAPTLVDRLKRPSSQPQLVDYYSFSGGKNTLEFGLGTIRDKLANIYLQTRLNKPNDGLVNESSSSLAGPVFQVCAPGCTHVNSYVEYQHTNHTNLVTNQSIAMQVVALSR